MENIIADKFLFDKALFIQELKQENQPLTTFKRTLKDGYEYLAERFKSGENIEIIVKKQGWLIDQLLILAWQQLVDSDEFSLVAVGGYGRAELLLASDIDLMVIEKARAKKESRHKLESFLTFLWDFGLEVGHSVRTVKECRYEAKNDITIMTNMMESRLLCGSEKLYEDMRKATGPKKVWPTRKYFEAKLIEQKNRHEKFNDSESKLEPNVKESPGGLRDIQMISWVAKRHFDNIDLSSLVKHKFLTTDEYSALETGRNLLWRIRFALHMTTNRREDRLLFEYQRNVAELIGFTSKDNKGIEEFMKMYFKTIREMSRLNEMLLQHFQEEIIYKKRKEKIVPINVRFQKRNDFIEVVNKNIFKRYPFALFELFLLTQQDPTIKGVRASTIRLIRDNLYLIDDDFRNDIRNKSLFLEIIKQPNLVGHKFRMMHRYGVLGAYMPTFAAIEGQMQFDLFHIFTVDEHILTVIQNLRLLGTDAYKEKFPICNAITKKLPKLELLYLAGLFHDIAKGRGGDHAKLGVKDAISFCKLHQLSDYDSKLVGWLVEKHLLVSKTAQREDIDDPEVIKKFANEVRDQMHLNYLHILTVADICGTNPKLWNSWKSTLLTNLYQRTLYELRRGDEKPILKKERIKDTKQESLALISDKNILENSILELWKTVDEDYFLRHNPDEIAWHTEGILNHKNTSAPLVLIMKTSSRGGSLIFIYMQDRKNIFATATKAIEKLGLTVVDAKIITNKKGFTLDTFVVLENDGALVKTNERSNEIKRKILKDFDSTPGMPEKGKWIEKRQLKSFNLPTRVTFELDNKNNRTIMEVSTIDRPGVLSRIGMAMDLCGAKLQNAKIATYGERAEDIFYLQNDENKAIDDPLKFECLKNSIIDALS
jgi:[protein-PII] uridylyltransferase